MTMFHAVSSRIAIAFAAALLSYASINATVATPAAPVAVSTQGLTA